MSALAMDDLTFRARDTVAREAVLLDGRDWDAWLALYAADARIWVPAWRDEDSYVADDGSEISILSLRGGPMLAERVHRLRSGRSIASSPLPRTSHVLGQSVVDADPAHADRRRITTPFSCHVYMHKDARLITYAGRYEHDLRFENRATVITRKKVLLINDRIDSQLDFFYL